MEDEHKPYINKKRVSGEYAQLSIQLPKQLKDKLKDEASKNNVTVAKYVVETLTRIVNGDVVTIDTRENKEFEKIDVKLDTIINMVSKL